MHAVLYRVSVYPQFEDSATTDLVRALIAAARRGLEVRALIDDCSFYADSAKANLESAIYLYQSGVDVRCDDPAVTTHAKLLVIDGETVVLGSTNWNYYSVERNIEANVALLRMPEVARPFEGYFASLWAEGRSIVPVGPRAWPLLRSALTPGGQKPHLAALPRLRAALACDAWREMRRRLRSLAPQRGQAQSIFPVRTLNRTGQHRAAALRAEDVGESERHRRALGAGHGRRERRSVGHRQRDRLREAERDLLRHADDADVSGVLDVDSVPTDRHEKGENRQQGVRRWPRCRRREGCGPRSLLLVRTPSYTRCARGLNSRDSAREEAGPRQRCGVLRRSR